MERIVFPMFPGTRHVSVSSVRDLEGSSSTVAKFIPPYHVVGARLASPAGIARRRYARLRDLRQLTQRLPTGPAIGSCVPPAALGLYDMTLGLRATASNDFTPTLCSYPPPAGSRCS